MPDRSRTYISSVRASKSSGASPDKRRKYDEAFKAEALRLASESRSTQAAARQLGISPKLRYRWQQAQVVAEVGRVEVARDPEVRALRPANKRLAQELDMLKKALVIFGQPISCALTATLPNEPARYRFASAARCCGWPRLPTTPGSAASRCQRPSPPGKWPCAKRLRITAELLDGGSFPGLAEAQLETSYHVAYYKAERRHSALGYQSPNHFETHLQTASQLCPA
jgi:transposase